MLNKVMLIGRLGKDPELRHTSKGEGMCTLNLATDSSWTDRMTGEKRTATEWHRVVFFGKNAENLARYKRKGALLYIEGRLQTRSWQGQDGSTRYTTEVVVSEVKFLDFRPNEPVVPGGDFPDYGRPAWQQQSNYGGAPMPPPVGGAQPFPQPVPMGGAPSFSQPGAYPNDTAADLSSRPAPPQNPTTNFPGDLAGDDVPF